ncbi:MAG: aromatic ring-hydroxylating dioxygenase subunit alpha [Myxococcota bacterium]|nr:aromatic ring-hydroxylating dioxygenase subunit alpha [Myxococcota bacterium]
MVNDLKEMILAFDPMIPVDEASTPPSSWYVSPTFLDWEYATVFNRSWIAVGAAQQVSAPGAYLAGQVGHEPFVVVRDQANQLRAFYNVCRHHAACLVEGQGKIQQFACPYHGWKYALDGRLTKAPQLGAIKNFDPSAFGLKALRVVAWHGIIFIHFGEPIAGPAAQWPILDERLSRSKTDHLQFVERRSYALECNWKVFCDNYLDGGYHVALLHPALGGQLDLSGYQTEVFSGYSIQSAAATKDGHARLGSGALYGFVYPNLMINRYGPIMDVNVVMPTGPDSCRVDFDFFFDPATLGQDTFVRESIQKSEDVQREDMQVCRSVQRGLRSSAYDVGRYAPRLEQGMHAFHCDLARDLRRGMQP